MTSLLDSCRFPSISLLLSLLLCLTCIYIYCGLGLCQGLVPLAGSNDESWCQGLDGLASRTAAYYQQGARFAKW